MSDIRAQYKTLLELKSIEEKIARLGREAEQIPQQIRQIELGIGVERQKLQTAQADQENLEKTLRRGELDLREREEKLKKAQDKLMEVKKNQEYQAALKENETQRQEKSAYEESIIKMMSELDEKKIGVTAAQSVFGTQETDGQLEIQKLQGERQQVLKLMEDQMSARNSLLANLPPATAAIYQRSVKRAESIPIAIAEAGRCGGCHMIIRPQLFNEILGYKTIHRCGSCGRILVLPEAPPENRE